MIETAITIIECVIILIFWPVVLLAGVGVILRSMAKVYEILFRYL